MVRVDSTDISADFQLGPDTKLCTFAFGNADGLYYAVFVARKVKSPLVEGASCDMH